VDDQAARAVEREAACEDTKLDHVAIGQDPLVDFEAEMPWR
jgi:hypothetical protein